MLAGNAVLVELGDQSEFLVRPDSVAQIIDQFDHSQGLIGRPVWIDQQFESAIQSGGLMMACHGAPFALRFLDFAAACSWASLRR